MKVQVLRYKTSEWKSGQCTSVCWHSFGSLTIKSDACAMYFGLLALLWQPYNQKWCFMGSTLQTNLVVFLLGEQVLHKLSFVPKRKMFNVTKLKTAWDGLQLAICVAIKSLLKAESRFSCKCTLSQSMHPIVHKHVDNIENLNVSQGIIEHSAVLCTLIASWHIVRSL